jgi:hypothetical protein
VPDQQGTAQMSNPAFLILNVQIFDEGPPDDE